MMGRVVSDMRAASFAGAALSATLIKLGKSVGSTFANVQQGIVTVVAKLRGGANEIKIFNKEVLRLSKSTEHTATTVTSAFGVLAQRGLSGKQSIQAAPNVLSLATATDTDPSTASDILIGALQSTRQEMSKSTEMADLLAAAHNRTAATMEELAGGIRFAGPVVEATGGSFKGMVAALAAARAGFLSTTIAGRGMSSLIGQLQKFAGTSGKAGKAIRELGLESLILERDRFPEMSEITEVLKRKFDALGGNMNKFGAILGRAMPNNARRFISVLINMQDEQKRVLGELDNVSGFAQNVATKRLNTLAGRFAILTSNLEALAEGIGAKLEPTFNKLIKTGQGVINFLNKLDKETIQMGAKFAVVFTAVGGAVAALGILVTLLRPIVSIISLVGAAFTSAFTLPVGAALLAVFGLLALAGSFANAWPDALDDVKSGWNTVRDATMDAIRSAIKYNTIFGNAVDKFFALDDAQKTLASLGFAVSREGVRDFGDGKGEELITSKDDLLKRALTTFDGPEKQRRTPETMAKVVTALETIGKYDEDAPSIAKELAQVIQERDTRAPFNTGSIVENAMGDVKAGFLKGLDMLEFSKLGEMFEKAGQGGVDALFGDGAFENLKTQMASLGDKFKELKFDIANAKIGAPVTKKTSPWASAGEQQRRLNLIKGHSGVASPSFGSSSIASSATMAPGVGRSEVSGKFMTKGLQSFGEMMDTIGVGGTAIFTEFLEWLGITTEGGLKQMTFAMDDMSQAADKFIGKFNEAGEFEGGALVQSLGQFQGAIEAFLSGDIVGGIFELLMQSDQFKGTMTIIGGILQEVANLIGSVLEPLKPIFGAISILANSILKPLVPAFEALGAMFAPFASILVSIADAMMPFFEIVTQILVPVFEFAAQIMRVFAAVVGVVMKVIESVIRTALIPIVWIFNAIITVVVWVLRAVDAVIGFITDAAGDLADKLESKKVDIDAIIKKAGDSWKEVTDDPFARVDNNMGRAADEADRLSDTLSDVNGELRNVPQGFKIAAARFSAQDAMDASGKHEVGRVGSKGLTGRRPHRPGFATGGLIAGRGLAMVAEQGPELILPLSRLGSLGGTTSHNYTIHALDPADAYRKIREAGRREDLAEGRVGARYNTPRFR